MENIVISAKSFNGFLVKFPYNDQISFVATSYKALKDGLRVIKWPYKPDIFVIETYGKPKFRKLNSIQKKTIYNELNIK